MPSKLSRNNRFRKIAKWVAIFVLFTTAFFANRTYQSHLGQQALASLELEILDLPEAQLNAKASGKLILANLSALYCSSCRKLDSDVFSHPSVKSQIEQNYVFARVDFQSDAGKTFMKKYRVSGFHVLLVLNDSGEKITRLPLTFSPEEFVDNLSMVNAVYSEVAAAPQETQQ